MFPSNVNISCVLIIEDLVTVMTLVAAWKVDVFYVVCQGILPLSCLPT